jgi:hypothetical protein
MVLLPSLVFLVASGFASEWGSLEHPQQHHDGAG